MQGTGGFINPEKVLNALNLKEGLTMADFGCGHGYFTIPAARLIWPEGKMYAVDVLDEALQAVRSRAQLEGITNIESIRGDLETPAGSKIADGSADIVLLHNILFQSQNKSAIIKEVKRVLKNGGLLHLAEWLPASVEKQINFGPQEGWRLTPEEAKRLAQEEGFVFQRNFDAGEYHYGLVFTKP